MVFHKDGLKLIEANVNLLCFDTEQVLSHLCLLFFIVLFELQN
jgi:hypothetical protein